MTDQDHVVAVKVALERLNEAAEAAEKAGLRLEFFTTRTQDWQFQQYGRPIQLSRVSRALA